jgi:hypothetical protein
MRLLLSAVVVMLGMVVFTGAATPARTALPDQKTALAGIQRAVAKGWIARADAARYRNTVNRAAKLVRGLPRWRRIPLAANLHQVAQVSGKLTSARASAVLGQLAVNNKYFAKHGPPTRETDIADADGVVYRYVSGSGFEFHPLANFGALNARIAGGTPAAAERLALALAERGVNEPGGGLGWEYYFNYAGGRAPWLSGMAQAVAAQAFAKTAGFVEADSTRLMATARAAFRTIPGRLTLKRAAGPWIRLYGFNKLVVLNAQLQSVISIRDYASANADGAAAALAIAMERAAATDLHRFDTGYWTYYSLAGTPSPVDYQRFVVQLLRKLDSADSRLSSAATRFSAYSKQPPAFKLVGGGPGTVHFWLSKPASVEMRSAAGSTKRLALHGGWYDLGWKLPGKAGAYSVSVKARDWAGNSSSFTGLPIVRVVAATNWKVEGSSASQTKSIRDAAEAGVVARTATTTTAASNGQASFAVGAGLDSGAQSSLASSASLDTVRLTVSWSPGASAPDAATVANLGLVPAAQRLIVELATGTPPSDVTGRRELAAFAGSLVAQVPNIDELQLGPAPTIDTAPAYVAALGALRDVVRAKLPALVVAGELDGASSPSATLTALAEALSDSGRGLPIMDELAFKPAPEAAQGSWTIDSYATLVAGLDKAFSGTVQKGSTLPILVDGVATPTTIPAEKASLYPSPPGPVPGVSESVQKSAYKQALQSAVCRPNISGVVFSRLVDRAGGGEQAADQSGLYYADGSAKTDVGAVAKSAALAARGALEVCPGLRAAVVAKTLVFPLGFSSRSTPWVTLACSRDCAYLVTLERPDGKPVRAKRGVVQGGVTSKLNLSGSVSLATGSGYHLRVRLIASTSPGPIRQYLSPPFSVQ